MYKTEVTVTRERSITYFPRQIYYIENSGGVCVGVFFLSNLLWVLLAGVRV